MLPNSNISRNLRTGVPDYLNRKPGNIPQVVNLLPQVNNLRVDLRICSR